MGLSLSRRALGVRVKELISAPGSLSPALPTPLLPERKWQESAQPHALGSP